MNCPYPEHHSSGGGWGGPIAAIFAAMIAAVVLGPLLHWLEIALACVGIGAAITAGLVVRRRWRQRPAIPSAWQAWQRVPPGRYVPQMQPPQQRQQPPAVQDGGQHLHVHLGGLTAAERAEAIRQLRGGQ